MAISRITVLVENTASGHDLLAEHGLAFWIEFGRHRVLFDTGQGNVLSGNAHQLGVRLELTDAVILSHGHYDHTGGLPNLLQTRPRPKVYAHPAAFQSKYARNTDGTVRNIGIPSLDESKVRQKAHELIWTNGPTEICPGLFVTGKIPRVTDFEDTGGPFFLDQQCHQPDPLIDDQAVYFDSSEGTVVLLGCAHAGVINTLQYIRQLTDHKPIHALMGGMHLMNASRERIHRTVESLEQFEIDLLAPAHCTGMVATTELCTAFANTCLPCAVGATMEFKVS